MVTYLKKHKNHLSAITAPILKTVYAENNEQFLWENNEQFYECSKQNQIYSKQYVHRENFINVETDFINAEKLIQLLWNSNMKKHSDLAFRFRKHDFTRCFMRKQGNFFF